MTLKLAIWLALFFGLTVVTQGLAEDYYIYQTANGELVISNKQPPPGSTIIKQLPGETVPAQESGKPGRGSFNPGSYPLSVSTVHYRH